MKKILLAMADGEIIRPLKFTLSRKGYHVLLARSEDRAMELMRREMPRMMIVDSSLPGEDGYELCRRVRKDDLPSQPFVILLTHPEEKNGLREGVERGADDYVPKPIDPQILALRVEELMRRSSREDGHIPVTGLPDVRLVRKEIKRCIDWQESFALCAVNLDHFRAYNEVYGFEVGDRAIQRVRDILLQVKRDMKLKQFYLSHMVADRFLLLMSPERVESYCQSVVEQFEKGKTSLFTQSDLHRGHLVAIDRTGRTRRFALLAVSIGVIIPESTSFHSVGQAIDAALWAMSEAKVRCGSNYYIRKDGPMGLLTARHQPVHKRILVVNGDEVHSRLLKSKLEREGYDVRTSAGGPEAVEMVRQDPPDLIFVDDYTIAEGCHMAACLKKDIRAAAIPLVMSTSSGNAEQVRSAGVDDCLIKPYSFKYLMSKLEEHLAGR